MNTPAYLEPHLFTTRSAEVSREKPSEELVLDQTHLTVKKMENKDKCRMHSELQIFQFDSHLHIPQISPN